MEQEIYYKVVGKDHRRGSNFTIFAGEYNFERWRNNNQLTWSEIEKFFPVYKKGSIVKAVEGSVGILCFINICRANIFMRQYDELTSDAEIIRVRGIGSPKYGKDFVLISSASNINVFYNYSTKYRTMIAPIGSIAFDAVEVLD